MATTYMPAYFVLLKEDENTIKGTVNNDEELQGALEAFERCSLSSFVHWSRGKSGKNEIPRVMWTTDDIIPGFTVPYTTTSRCIKRCTYGGKPKTCQQKTSSSKNPDHDYTRSKRVHMQGSRKIGCEAKLHIKTLALYEDYKVPKGTSRSDKELKLLELNRNCNTATSSSRTVIILPKPCKHTNHVVTIESGMSHRILPKIRDRIYELVSMGFTTVPLVRRMLQEYVKELGVKPHSHDQAYYPKPAVIRRHIHGALVAGRYTNVDQDNLEIKLKKMEEESPGLDKFFLRKCGAEAPEKTSIPNYTRVFQVDPEDEAEEEEEEEEACSTDETPPRSGTFLFVHQNKRQQKLLQKYGKLVLLDATYKTSKYALPLFLLVVRTNTNYMPVAEFIVERETRSNIQEALAMLKEWNPGWEPSFFMLDYSNEEYQALHAVFPSAKKYLCSFHREQAWHRWMKNGKNGIPEKARDNLLQLLRTLASSRDQDAFAVALARLQTDDLYRNNAKVQKYLDTFWLSIPERWCALHAGPGFEGLITTNNGVESLNHSLKNCLKISGNGTLSCLVQTMIETFLHNHWISYVQQNYDASSQSRPYRSHIPAYLHNRPKGVVEKCMKSHAAASYCHPRQIDKLTSKCFVVQSEGKETDYTVNLGDEGTFPHCSCPYFRDHLLPCKHMFALFANKFATWEELPLSYRQNPYMTLDADVLSREAMETSISQLSTQSCDPHETEPQDASDSEISVTVSSVSLSAAQQHFREVLKELTDLSYISTDADLLYAKSKLLEDMVHALKEVVPSQSGLPLHQGTTAERQIGRQLPTRKKRKRISSKSATACQRRRPILQHPQPARALHHRTASARRVLSSAANKICQQPLTRSRRQPQSVPVTGSQRQPQSVPVTGSQRQPQSVPVTGSQRQPQSVPVTGSQRQPQSVPVTRSQRQPQSVPVQPEHPVPVTGSQRQPQSVPVQPEHPVPVTGSQRQPQSVPVQPEHPVPVTRSQRQPLQSVRVQPEVPVIVHTLDPLVKTLMDQEVQEVIIEREKTYHVNGMAVTSESLLTLRYPQWLDDKVIDTFLRKLAVSQNGGDSDHLFVFPATTSSLWNQGQYAATFYPLVRFSLFRWIFVPLNVRASHWVLLVVDSATNCVSVLDSLGSKQTIQQCMKQWSQFLSARCEALNKPALPWKPGTLVSGKQTDGVSCGAFVLMNAFALLRGWNVGSLSQDTSKAFRLFVLYDLLQGAGRSPAVCLSCDMPGCQSHSEERVPCCVCWRWTHWQDCAGLHQKPGEDFMCAICTAQYGDV